MNVTAHFTRTARLAGRPGPRQRPPGEQWRVSPPALRAVLVSAHLPPGAQGQAGPRRPNLALEGVGTQLGTPRVEFQFVITN